MSKTTEIDLHVARTLVGDLEEKIKLEINEAARKIRDRHKDEMDRLIANRTDAMAAHTKSLDALPGHEWEGRKVYVIVSEGPSYRRTISRIEGVIETRRSNTQFAENASRWSIPRISEAFVRLLTKSGKPGLKFKRLHPGDGWKLVDEKP